MKLPQASHTITLGKGNNDTVTASGNGGIIGFLPALGAPTYLRKPSAKATYHRRAADFFFRRRLRNMVCLSQLTFRADLFSQTGVRGAA
jgi:hypothetical protein